MQCDQSGRIFAYWAIVYIGHFLNNKISSAFWDTFSTVKIGWATFWTIFSKTRQVTMVKSNKYCT
jgi:hypothetical protein